MPTVNFDPQLAQLQNLLASGRHDELEALANALLNRQSSNRGLVSYLLGVSRLMQGRPDAAIEPLARAAQVQPRNPDVLRDLAICYNNTGDFVRADETFRRCLSLIPQDVGVRAMSAANALQMGDPAKAKKLAEKTLSLDPRMPDAMLTLIRAERALGNLQGMQVQAQRLLKDGPQLAELMNDVGLLMMAEGFFQLAAELFGKGLDLAPNSPVLLFQLGHAQLNLGDYQAALSSHERALVLDSGIAEVHNSYGNVFFRLERYADAVDCYRKAIELKPSLVEAYCNLGCSMAKLGAIQDALDGLQRLIEMDPERIEAYLIQGDILFEANRFVDAAKVFRAALSLTDFPKDYSDLAVRLGLTLTALGQHQEAAAFYRSSVERSPGSEKTLSAFLFAQNYFPETTAYSYQLDAARYAALFDAPPAIGARQKSVASLEGRPVRIGLVSKDFRRHPVGFLLSGILPHFDRARLDVVLYANQPENDDDELTTRLRDNTGGWVRIHGVADRDVAARIRSDKVDVLIDLSGHTEGGRLPLFALKTAPVQATWMGYFASTGLSQIDYIIADPVVLPESESGDYSEKPLRLPHCYYCYTPPVNAPDVDELPLKKTGGVTFGSFNNRSKINTAVIGCWSAILAAVPESRLYLKTKGLTGEAERRLIEDQFAACGIAPERLHIEGGSSFGEYLVAFQNVDIALDPFPYPGGMTSLDGLWMGVPVLTLKGRRFVGHHGEMYLHNLGLGEWIAESEEEYIAMAISYAKDVDYLSNLRSQLRERMRKSALCQPEQFARDFEHLIWQVWREWCSAPLIKTPGK